MTRFVAVIAALLIAAPACAQKVLVLGGVPINGHFTVSLPGTPTNPSPANGATGISLTVSLTWSCANGQTFTVTTDTPTGNSGTLSSASFNVSGLANSTTYHWTVTCINSAGSTTGPTWSFTTLASGAESLITAAGITCAGVFISPNAVAGAALGSSYALPTAYRYEAGTRHYFMLDGQSQVYEYPEPATLSPCNTALGSVVQASLESWTANGCGNGCWGQYPINPQPTNWRPPYNASFYYGMSYDATLGYLMANWAGTYSVIPPGQNSFAAVTLNNSTHAMSLVGCWAVTNGSMTVTGSGTLRIPSSWASTNLGGANFLAEGFGSQLGTANSMGPSLIAFPTSAYASNVCDPGTNYPIGTGTILSQYPQNTNGPTCPSAGCTPVSAPTTPYPALTAMSTYSVSAAPIDWDPYNFGAGTTCQTTPSGCNGWWTWQTFGPIGWYEDGTNYGVLVPYEAPEGWANTTVSASPAPTISYPNITWTQPTTTTNDGNNINPGDEIVVQTCTVGIDPGCASANGNSFSFVVVDTVNTGTGAMTGHITGQDSGSGSHAPVVGGGVQMGAPYIHGSPNSGRFVLRLQIYDPAQYAQVVATPQTRAPYNVRYHEDVDTTTWFQQFGCPSCAVKGVTSLAARFPIAAMIDTTAKQLIISYGNAIQSGGIVANLNVVLNLP